MKKELSEESLAQAAACLKTIAHPVRLKLIQLILHDSYTVNELADTCSIPQNVASEHLRLMERCGLFKSTRDGKFVYYRVCEPHLKNIMTCIEKRFA